MLDTPQRTRPPASDLHAARDVLGRLKGRLTHAVRGRDDVTDLLLVALMADGHVLLEDFPGSGKTTLAKALGESIMPSQGETTLHSFRRIQFTPDLLPSDITGVSIFEPKSAQFHFQPGPLFAYVVLADEINRTSPKVQAAMLESMAEKQVTADNVTYPLDDLFFVIATQNPRDQVGTYPLPVAQLDRFCSRSSWSISTVMRNWKFSRPIKTEEKLLPRTSLRSAETKYWRPATPSTRKCIWPRPSTPVWWILPVVSVPLPRLLRASLLDLLSSLCRRSRRRLL